MCNKKKILLGTSGFFGQSNVDLYLDINLQRTFNEIRPEKYENDFDVQQQYDLERNSSRNFFIYGLVDSIIDLSQFNSEVILELWREDQVPVDVTIENPQILSYSPQNEITLNNGSVLKYIQPINTTDVSYNTGNIVGYPKKKYYTQLNNFTGETVYLFINGDLMDSIVNSPEYSIENQLIRKQIVYRRANGEFIPFGTNSRILDIFGTDLNVENDYPFFYNIHWIKQDVNIEKTYIPSVSFEFSEITLTEGQQVNVNLVLNKLPAPGSSSVFVNVLNSTTNSSDYTISFPTIGQPNPNNQIKFNGINTTQTFTISANTDSEIEVSEKFSLELSTFVNSTPGPITKLDVTILNPEIQNEATYVIPTNYKNQTSFGTEIGFNQTSNLFLSNSVFRDGYFTSNSKDPNSLYVNDSYFITIINKGNDTIFPEDNGLINTTFVFKSNDSYTFEIKNTFNNSTQHSLMIDILLDPVGGIYEIFDIDGFIYNNIKSTDDLFNALNASSVEKRFSYTLINITDADGNIIKKLLNLKSLTSGLPIFVRRMNIAVPVEKILIYDSGVANLNPYTFINPDYKFLKLKANDSNGTRCKYEFLFTKQGYKDVFVSEQSLVANTSNPNYFLVTGYDNISVAYDGVNCVNQLFTQNIRIDGFIMNYQNGNNTNQVYGMFENSTIASIPCTVNNTGLFNGFKI